MGRGRAGLPLWPHQRHAGADWRAGRSHRRGLRGARGIAGRDGSFDGRIRRRPGTPRRGGRPYRHDRGRDRRAQHPAHAIRSGRDGPRGRVHLHRHGRHRAHRAWLRAGRGRTPRGCAGAQSGGARSRAGNAGEARNDPGRSGPRDARATAPGGVQRTGGRGFAPAVRPAGLGSDRVPDAGPARGAGPQPGHGVSGRCCTPCACPPSSPGRRKAVWNWSCVRRA